uniref:Glycerate kinase n=1 Tax=Hirondellea gigas TaxID=1518452 RepID=A0A2P2I823_9CRUS
MTRNSIIGKSLSLLTDAFQEGVHSVLPHLLIPKFVRRENESLLVGHRAYKLNNNVHLVGFGKAVITMIKPIEDMLRNSNSSSHLVSGVVSVPWKIQESIQNVELLPDNHSCVEIMEGAKNNIPDHDAFDAAKKILNVVQDLKLEDLLIVLISGGGSALLPMPIPPITLEEKSSIVRQLSTAGADIVELNTVRKAISAVKGGKLAENTKATIISLILSDVIDSSLDIIASGPTVPNTDHPGKAMEIISKYNVIISPDVRHVMSNQLRSENVDFPDASNNVIGDNKLALEATRRFFKQKQRDCHPIVVTSSLKGEAAMIGHSIVLLSKEIIDGYRCGHIDITPSLLLDLHVERHANFIEEISRCVTEKLPLCLLFGGESTVEVKGTGVGGRNQEMVLAATIHMKTELPRVPEDQEPLVVLLSAGTDGLDGPTTAAGALTYWTPQRCLYDDALDEDVRPERYLARNDSHSFFRKLSSGKYLVQPGHTGTNVMDLQMLYIRP